MKETGKIREGMIFILFIEINLTACGGGGGDSNITNGNTAPVANAGPDQKVSTAGVFVNLSGNGSDTDGDSLTYAWSFTTMPVGSDAALSNLTTADPTFTADKVGKYLISLTVNDGQIDSDADTVTVLAGMLPVPDTGQTISYSIAFGDDGDYTINPMSYTDNYDGTISNNITGLTWQKCSIGQSGTACAGGAAATWNWYEANGTYDATYNTDTTDVCGALGDGWRLPARMELQSLAGYGVVTPSITGAYFPNTKTGAYWASTTYAANTTDAWNVDFNAGITNYYRKTGTHYVRCVRGQ